MKRRLVLLLALVSAVGLVTAACGTRVPEQTKVTSGGGLGGGGGGAGAGVAAAQGLDNVSADGKVMFGSLESPCGPGDAKGSFTPGVTDTEIRIGTIADVSGPKPGLNKGMHDSMKAFEKWCNDQGGINGRKLKVDLLDSKLLNYQDTIKGACDTQFALVGGLGVLDQTGAQDAVDCGLVMVPGAAVSPEQTGASNVVQPMPNLINKYLIGPADWVAKNYPDAIKHAGNVYSNFQTTQQQSDKLIEAYTQRGFDFTFHESANVNESNWAPIVVAMKNRGVKYFTLTSSFEEIVPLQAAMAQQDYKPEVIELETNFYNDKYPKDAGATADGTFVRLTAWPFEEADQNPAMKQYLEALKAAVPDAAPELLGVQAFSAGLLFATAAKNAGSNLTRETLFEELKKIHKWNGGGLQGTSDPGGNVPSTCFIIMEVKDGGFVRKYPLPDADADVYNNDVAKGMACPPPEEGLASLTGNYGEGAKKR
ncbi:MAG: ABC transporter substrate-binding protein [Acidimicrobiales bacterium]